ncbi:MAG: N-acetylmuramic acid 6-phosphate etherase [Planctomycetota bacterium JB042]
MSDTLEYLRRIHDADRQAFEEVGKALPSVAEVVDAIAAKLRAGGRWFYVGAGTSGRMCVLDAAELPPTFGIATDRVVALMAGGDKSLRLSLEEVEDDVDAGARDLKKRKLTDADAVVAVAASGTTPYVRSALQYAREKGALTVAIVCNPGTPIAEASDLALQLHTGPEVVNGSTRMKAGLAQKMILTMVSTAVMARLGLVYDDEMVAMRPTNTKLRARAARIVTEVTGIEKPEALALLESSKWDLPVSLVRSRFRCTVEEARERLDRHRGSVREALEEPAP